MATADPFEHGLLPAQFLHDRSMAPEQRLWLATLLAAVRSACASRTSLRRHDTLEADLAWFASDDETPPQSFLAICRTLALDAGRFRRFVAEHAGTGLVIGHRTGGVAARYEQPSIQPFARDLRPQRRHIRPVTAVA